MTDRFRSADRSGPLHGASALGIAGGPESRRFPAPNLMFVPEAAPTRPDCGPRSVWRFGRYIGVY